VTSDPGTPLRTADRAFARDRIGTSERFTIVEVGVKEGFHAKLLSRTMPGSVIYAVDPYIMYYEETYPDLTQEAQEGFYRDLIHHSIESDGKIVPIRLKSDEAAKFFADESIDYIYIDGDHTKDGVQLDIVSWLPKVKNGGIIGGHDWDIVGPFINDMLKNITHDVGQNCLDWWTTKGNC
jgi:predicted O-methyltransferase YrrM